MDYNQKKKTVTLKHCNIPRKHGMLTFFYEEHYIMLLADTLINYN